MENLAEYIEHTLLRQDAKADEVIKLCDEAKKYKFKGVCVNLYYVELAKKQLKDTGVLVVAAVGFPLGASTTESKVFETKDAILNGADEIDMVINVSALKNKDYDYVLNDIKSIKAACGEKLLKVILETDLLDKDEIKKASELSAKADADFVKTSTGFVKNGVGAKAEDVRLMKETTAKALVLRTKPGGVKNRSITIEMINVLEQETAAKSGLGVKASGGIKDRATALKMIEAGATRLGTSSGVAIVSHPD